MLVGASPTFEHADETGNGLNIVKVMPETAIRFGFFEVGIPWTLEYHLTKSGLKTSAF
jgi:hypothetical protein